MAVPTGKYKFCHAYRENIYSCLTSTSRAKTQAIRKTANGLNAIIFDFFNGASPSKIDCIEHSGGGQMNKRWFCKSLVYVLYCLCIALTQQFFHIDFVKIKPFRVYAGDLTNPSFLFAYAQLFSPHYQFFSKKETQFRNG